MMDATTPRRGTNLQFDPDLHPHSTLKAFNEFIEQYEFRYEAQYPEVPRSVHETALLIWQGANGGDDPTAEEKVDIMEDTVSKDKVRKLLGFFASIRAQQDWKAAEPIEANRKCSWSHYLTKMREYYRPTENTTLRNYEFHQIVQGDTETFSAFCNRVEKEGRTCYFCDNEHENCNAPEVAIRDQIVIGTNNDIIREKALFEGWNFSSLRKEGMKVESASLGKDKMSNATVSKLGAYSYKNMTKNNNDRRSNKSSPQRKNKCYRCGDDFNSKHLRFCEALKAKCEKCGRIGHLAKVCQQKAVNATDATDGFDCEDNDNETFRLNIWRIRSPQNDPEFVSARSNFRCRLVVNNCSAKLLVDTGAKVSVCGMKQAIAWGLNDRIIPSSAKIFPYRSDPIKVKGIATCAVSFHDRSIPVDFFILPGSCEPILAGSKAILLKILTFKGEDDSYNPILMIDNSTHDKGEFSLNIQNILQHFPQNFKGLGKLRNHQVKLFTDQNIRPVTVPPRTIPYHLKARVDEAISQMEESGVIEPHPMDEPAPWVSCAQIVPKPDGEVRITLDARNINKAIQSSNHPIPRHEDIKAQLAGAKFFSKLDFKSAFWQLELHPESRYLTVFHANDKLYRYKRLLMGVKPAQGELNNALRPLFSHIGQVHLIHEDVTYH